MVLESKTHNIKKEERERERECEKPWLGLLLLLGNLRDSKEIPGFETQQIAVFKTRFAPSPKRLLRVLTNSLKGITKPRSK